MTERLRANNTILLLKTVRETYEFCAFSESIFPSTKKEKFTLDIIHSFLKWFNSFILNI